MPFPRSQVDVILVSAVLERAFQEVHLSRLQEKWVAEGYLLGCSPTVFGQEYFGFGKVKQIRFEPPEIYRLYANHQGGYRVYCPTCMGLATSAFVASVRDWRSGRGNPFDNRVVCGLCGEESPLPQMIGQPTLAFSKGAIVFSDVENVQMNTAALHEIVSSVGLVSQVVRRVG